MLSLTFSCAVFPVLHKFLPYELSLRLHQLVSAVLAYACWCHIPSSQRFYAYVCAGIFLATCISQLTLLIFPNCLGLCNAVISSDGYVIRMELRLKRQPIMVPAGKYINICIPRLTTWRCWSILQSHPFTVTSWQAGPVDRMELIITPQNGWTSHLFEKAQQRSSIHCWAFITGPHGLAANVGDYERILVFASQFGIIPCIPYLQHIMDLLPRRSPASQHPRPQHSRLEHVHICWESQREVVILETFLQGLVNCVESSRRRVGLYSPTMKNSRIVFSETSESVVAERRKIPFQEILDDELKGKHKDHKLLILGM